LMSAPENLSVAEVATRTSIPEATLYHWRNQARSQGLVVPGDGHHKDTIPAGADPNRTRVKQSDPQSSLRGATCRSQDTRLSRYRAPEARKPPSTGITIPVT
jgi:transposase-like protein